MSLEGLRAADLVNVLREADRNRHYTKKHAIYYGVLLRALLSCADDSDCI